MLLALLLLTQNPVTVRLNHDQFNPGDRARVYVQTLQDGYLVVLHADADGRIRVLFPLDPTDDDFVRGGKEFELRGRSDRDAFQVQSNDGSGTVLAAVSPDAFNFEDFVRNDHWDFRALGAPSGEVRNDPLARLTEIVQKISGDSAGRFDYDYATYVVNSRAIASRYGYGGGYYPHFGVGYYNPFFDPFCADPFYGWSASCYTFGVGWGYSGGYRFGFGYGYGFPIYRPYVPYRPYIFAGVPGPRFAQPRMVIPSRPTRYVPTQVRPRVDPGETFTNRSRGEVRPAPSRPQPRVSSGGSRPTVSRPSAPRPSSGSRGGGGGRRH
jgi:hypothetical protein